MNTGKFKIDKVKLWWIRLPYREPFTTSFGTEDTKETIIVGLKSRDIWGYGELVASRMPRYSYETIDTATIIMEKYLIPTLLKEATGPMDFINKISWIKGHNMAKASIEMALWDLYAKKEKKPLYKILGGVRKYVDVGVSIGIQKDIDTLINKIGEYLDNGYGRIKIKIKPKWDIEVLHRVRKEYPEIKLTVDANSAYRLDKHIDILKKLDNFNLLYIEQPLEHYDIIAHSKLQRELSTPICLDESITDSHKAWEAIEAGATKVINIKPGRVGGINQSKIIHDISQKNGIPTWIGGMLETGIGRAHNVSLATLENIRFPSDLSASDRYYKKDIITEPFTLEKESKLKVREGEGIGVEIDWDYFNKIVYREKEHR